MRGSSAARSATPCSELEVGDVDVAVPAGLASTRPRSRARPEAIPSSSPASSRPGGSPPTTGRGASTSPSCAAARSRRTWPCATSPSTRSRRRFTAASRSTRPAAAPTSPRASCGRPRARSFADDPLRVLRAARIAAALSLEVEAGTLELARAVADRAAEPAGERQFAELALLLGGPEPLRGVELLDELGATPAVLPEVEALRGVGQSANHHLDAHGHTLEVLRRCAGGGGRSRALRRRGRRRGRGAAGGAAGRRAHPARRAFASRRSCTTSASRRRGRSARAGSASSATTPSAPR